MNENATACDRQLPIGEEIFLDHVGAFVSGPDAAAQLLTRLGFAPTPASVQVNPDPAGGPPLLTGTGNVCAMLERGYLELLFKTADTPIGREFDAARTRYTGLHLAAFAIADADRWHARLAAQGFAMQPVVEMKRPVATEQGADVAAFSVVRLVPGQMPEGRIQVLRHRTESAVWQPRWLTHPNTAVALAGLVIAVADVSEAAARFARFLSRPTLMEDGRAHYRLDRGTLELIPASDLPSLWPGAIAPSLPFMALVRVRVRSLDAAARCLAAGSLPALRGTACLTVPLPVDIGAGAWQFETETAGA